MLPLAAIMVLFVSMNVTVDEQRVTVHLGPGLLRLQFPLAGIDNCRVTRSSPLNFLGIRAIPGG